MLVFGLDPGKVEDDLAIVNLTIAPNLSSGYAAVDCGGHELKAGDQIRVRLLEKKGGRWSADLVSS